MNRPPVTVVVPVFNHGATIGPLLDALDRTNWPDLDIVAIDCGSTDGSLQLLRNRTAGAGTSNSRPLRLIEDPTAGRATALNRGFEAAGRRDVVRMHGDVVPDSPDWLERLHDVAEREADCGVVGAKIALAGGRIQSCGRDIVNGLGIVPEWSDRRWMEDDRDEEPRAEEVDSVTGELCFVRRAVLDSTGGVDPNYDPVFGDDDDFCLLARYHGFRVFVERGARGVHFAPRRTTMTGGTVEPTGQLDRLLELRNQLQGSWLDYFRRKWGFDPSGPDLAEVRRRYGHTRICWRIGDGLTEELPEQPAVDVCFPTWNSMKFLPRAMAHLAATSWSDMTIWITDNGSTDGTLEYLESLQATFPFKLHVEKLRQNVGCAQALNLAFASGTAPIVARLDDDTMVAPDWLERLVPRFHQRPYAGVIGPKVLADCDDPVLQSGPSRQWPFGLPVATREHDRVNGLARVATLRGCCNLYRRSVFAEVGMLDPRFSPSQFDEWDHHIAVAVRGYEVLYDGSTTVRHAITAGRVATPSALSNFTANLQKSNGKWGQTHFARLERGIDISIEGRFLPADGDTSALFERLPPAPTTAPRPTERPAEDIAEWRAVARRRSLLRSESGPLAPFFGNLVTIGQRSLDRDRPTEAAQVVRRIMDLGNGTAAGLAFLARFRAFDGDLDAAALSSRWCRLLDPTAVIDIPAPVVLVPQRPPVPAGSPRVLALPPADHDDDAVMLAFEHATAALRAAGAAVHIEDSMMPDAAGFDVVHAFGLGQASTLGSRLQCARATNPSVHIVLSSLYPDPSRANWTGQVLGSYFRSSDDELRNVCAAAAKGALQLEGSTTRAFEAEPFDGVLDYERVALAQVDRLIVHSEAEAHWLASRHEQAASPEIVPEGSAVPAPTTPVDDAAATVVRAIPAGAVLHVGQRDLPGHHLLLALALQGSGLPLAMCGSAALPFDDPRTRARGDADLQLLPEVTGPALFAALQRSAVLVWLPSAAPSFVLPLLAAQAGCELVLAQDVGAEAVFGDSARYVDPFDLDGVRAAVTDASKAWRADTTEGWRAALAEIHGARAYGERLLAAYRSADVPLAVAAP